MAHQQYSIADFVKYAKSAQSNIKLEKYYNGKIQHKSIYDNAIIINKLNSIMTKKNISEDDNNLYKLMMKTLNKVNNNMLIGGDNAIKDTISILTSIKYTKVEHFQKLSDLLVDKSLSEPNFCSLYALISFELSKYYIMAETKKVYFRNILLNLCQSKFETYITSYDNKDKTRVLGISRFIGELYNNGLLPAIIIKGCIERMNTMIEKANNITECIADTVMVTYKKIYEDKASNNTIIIEYIKKCLNANMDNNKLPLKNKFALQDALEKITKIET
jgi:hypothetical protein